MTWSEGRILERRDWAPGLFTLRVQAEIAPFEPGQFVNIGLRLEGELVFRAYSLASPPSQPLEFYVTEVQGGALTPRLCQLTPGESLLVEQHPQGFFTLRYIPDAPELWLLATGTGLGPFMSMLRSEEIWRRFGRLVLAHGVREAAQLSYRDELAELSAQHDGRLVWVPVVSRESAAGGVLHGRLTTTLTDGSLEQRAGVTLDPARSHVMLCGNPAMIHDVTALLEERGLRKHRQRKPGHISIEKYW
ncbi:MAG TPA: ferredoxin--NADP reductase [Polyangiaceae bacterium]|nr:ferredoxin--NADP reductase [Polyangiaceae bacterium]